MKFRVIFLVLAFFPAFFVTASPAEASPGDSTADPIIVTDLSQIPVDADSYAVDCTVYYTWSVHDPGGFTPGGEEIIPHNIYYQAVDDSTCDQYVDVRFVRVDRCGWRRDMIRVRGDDRILDVYIRQITKTKWRVKLLTDEQHIFTQSWRQTARWTLHLSNRHC